MGLGRTLVTGGSGFIGTNLIEALLERGTEFINIDKARPNIPQHDKFWRPLDIMDVEGLRRIFGEFRPETVIHLAALVDDRGRTLEDYAENTVGTMNVVRAGDAVGTVTRLILTSTQFVVKAGYVAKNDEDLAPHTLYGESKAEMERMVRAAPPRRTAWTIVRPTLVWGPWHPRYPDHAWRYLARRWYFHPVTARPVVRSYAYVGNVVSQMIAALERPAEPRSVKGVLRRRRTDVDRIVGRRVLDRVHRQAQSSAPVWPVAVDGTLRRCSPLVPATRSDLVGPTPRDVERLRRADEAHLRRRRSRPVYPRAGCGEVGSLAQSLWTEWFLARRGAYLKVCVARPEGYGACHTRTWESPDRPGCGPWPEATLRYG